jgi:hypothetical protein
VACSVRAAGAAEAVEVVWAVVVEMRVARARREVVKVCLRVMVVAYQRDFDIGIR